MRYSIKMDVMNHNYNSKVASTVDYLLNGIFTTPGLLVFDEENTIKLNSSGFLELEGKVEISRENDVKINFFLNNTNHVQPYMCLYRFENDCIHYVVSNKNGIYIYDGNIYDSSYKVYYYDENAKNYLVKKYESEIDKQELLCNPRKLFKKEGIKPDFKYSGKIDFQELNMSLSSYILNDYWVTECNEYMEGKDYEIEPASEKAKKIERKISNKGHH